MDVAAPEEEPDVVPLDEELDGKTPPDELVEDVIVPDDETTDPDVLTVPDDELLGVSSSHTHKAEHSIPSLHKQLTDKLSVSKLQL